MRTSPCHSPARTSHIDLEQRDEGMHCDFACLLYSKLEHKLTDNELHAIIKEAVEHEKEFIIEALPCALIGMNSDLMGQYIEFCADRLLVALNAPKLYGVKNPFDWMGERAARSTPTHAVATLTAPPALIVRRTDQPSRKNKFLRAQASLKHK